MKGRILLVDENYETKRKGAIKQESIYGIISLFIFVSLFMHLHS